MKKAIARNIDTNHIPVEKLNALLETFALKHFPGSWLTYWKEPRTTACPTVNSS